MLGKNKIRLKTVFENNQTLLMMKLSRKERVNDDLCRLLDQPGFSEFISPVWGISGGRSTLKFNTGNLISLEQFIRNEITQEKYFRLISQFQEIYEKCSISSMPVNNLVCNIKYAFYDIQNEKLIMIYAPVINSSYYSDIAGFLLTLFKRSNIVISDGNTINNYRQFLESKIYLQKKNKDKNAGFSYSDLCSFLHKNDNKNSDPSSAPAKNEHYQSDGQKHSQPGRTSSPVQSGSGIFGTYTDSAGSAKISKTVKASSISRRKKSIPQRELPFLEDEFHTMHQITGFPFSIGRDPSCDLVINDMNISSTHAVISDINGEYYISDNDSTNGTYINGGEISHEPLADGCEFSLYETKFVFHYAQSAPEKSEHEKSGTRQPLTKTHAVSGKKKPSEYTAYIQDVSNSQNYYISVYPWSSEKLPGVEITGSEKSLALRNISCDILSAESEKIEKGVSFPLFSGCSFSIGSSKYIFYMKY